MKTTLLSKLTEALDALESSGLSPAAQYQLRGKLQACVTIATNDQPAPPPEE